MENELSSYKTFVELRETAITDSKRFNIYDFSQNVGIECLVVQIIAPVQK